MPIATPASLSAETPFRALVRAFGTGKQVMEPYFVENGVSSAQWGVLRAIIVAESEGVKELRLTDLSTRLLIRPPSVTTVIDRLERAGFVTRSASTTDRRAKTIALTAKGRKMVTKVLASYDDQIAKVMSGLSATEQKQLCAMLAKLQAHLEGLLAEIPGVSSADSDSDSLL